MTTQPGWHTALAALVGADQCEIQAERLREYAVDGIIPSAIIWPQTVEQVATILLWAQREKLAVLPRGNGTKIGQGAMPKRLDIVLSLNGLASVNEYDAANFTITAEAGMTYSRLAQLTAAHMQMLPLQYPCSVATLGGLIGANAYSPKRMLYGGVRDLLLGVRIALPSGEVAHFGGKVVKNVAGYDMCKLFLGSLGALGVIVEATFKLLALPERDETMLAAFPSLGQGAAAVARLMGTQLLPSQILLLNSVAAQAIVPAVATQVVAGETLLLVNCEGMDEAVERQLADVTRISQGHGSSTVQVLAGDGQQQLRQRLEAATRYPVGKTPSALEQPSPMLGETWGWGAVVIRLGTLPSRVPMLMEAVNQALHPTGCEAMIVGDCGVGLVRLCLRHGSLTTGPIDESLLHTLRALPGLVVANGGYTVVEGAPPEVKMQLDAWGMAPSSVALLKALKRRFDPEDILSTGRLIGEL